MNNVNTKKAFNIAGINNQLEALAQFLHIDTIEIPIEFDNDVQAVLLDQAYDNVDPDDYISPDDYQSDKINYEKRSIEPL